MTIGQVRQGIFSDFFKLSRPFNIRAHCEQLAVAQPTASTMKTALGK
jgi:hypothetical protein